MLLYPAMQALHHFIQLWITGDRLDVTNSYMLRTLPFHLAQTEVHCRTPVYTANQIKQIAPWHLPSLRLIWKKLKEALLDTGSRNSLLTGMYCLQLSPNPQLVFSILPRCPRVVKLEHDYYSVANICYNVVVSLACPGHQTLDFKASKKASLPGCASWAERSTKWQIPSRITYRFPKAKHP